MSTSAVEAKGHVNRSVKTHLVVINAVVHMVIHWTRMENLATVSNFWPTFKSDSHLHKISYDLQITDLYQSLSVFP